MTLEEIVNNLKSAGQDYGQLFNNNTRMDATKQFGGQLQNNVTQGLEGLVPPSFSSVQDAKSPEYNKKLTDWSLGNGMGMSGMALAIKNTRMGDIGFDPRFTPRKLQGNELDRLNNLTTKIDVPDQQIQQLSLANYEGYPFITSMSDRTNVGQLQSINGVPLNVDLQGGQGYMFNNPGQVWASGASPVSSIMKHAQNLKDWTGKDPLYLPWTMSPTGGDYANMTGETMLRYMSNNMSKTAQRGVNKQIKSFIPNFSGIGSEEGINQFRNAPDTMRKNVKRMIDVNYRDEGGLSLPEARLAVADPNQLLSPVLGLRNVGQVFANDKVIKNSGHRAYPKGVPGQGLGMLDKNIMAHELLPHVVSARNIQNPRMPSDADRRSMELGVYSGQITSDLLKALGY